MQKWEQFEQNATEFLSALYPDFIFKNIGNTNSNAPDIKVYDKSNKHLFNMEIKYSPSQAGQIVVLDNDGTFEFSKKSKNEQVPATETILEYLNTHYNTYNNVAQSSIPIEIDSSVLYAFILEQYKLKGNKWIISSTKATNPDLKSICLIPLERIENNFKVSAVLRRKKSGTREIPKSMRGTAEKLISVICEEPILKQDGKKTYLLGDIGNNSYTLPENLYLSKKEEDLYEIRKRSSTNNANIIFSLELKDTYEFNGKEFLAYLNSFK